MTTTRRNGVRPVAGVVTRWVGGAVVVLATALLPAWLTAQTADVRITKTGPSQVDGAGVITYVIVTTNNGPSSATNVVVHDTLPPTSDFTFISASRGAARAGRRLTWPAINLTSGQAIVDTVVIQPKAGVGTVLTNVANVTANETDPNLPNNVSLVQTLVVDATVIAVSATPDGADTARRLPSNGTKYSYTFTVTNTGSVSTDFDLLAHLGGGAGSFVTVDSITGTGVTRGAPADSARLSGIAAGAASSVFVWYRVANVAAGPLDSLVLRARSVPVPTVVDSAWSYVRVVRPALLTVKSVAPAGVQTPGTELTYSVLVSNAGSENAAGVVIVDSLPAQAQFKVGSATSILPGGVTAVVEYSTDGLNWNYSPTSTACAAPAGFDGCVRRVRWTLQQPLSSVAPSNTATLGLVARIR